MSNPYNGRAATLEQIPSLNDGWEDIVSAGAGLIPDGIQQKGQEILDKTIAPIVEQAKSISPGIYKSLSAEAQKQIDNARKELGLPPVNPEGAPSATGTSTNPTSEKTPSTPASVIKSMDTTGTVAGGVVGALAGWATSKKSKSMVLKIVVPILTGAFGAVAGGIAVNEIKK